MDHILLFIGSVLIGFWIDKLISNKQGKLDPHDPKAIEETNRILRSLK